MSTHTGYIENARRMGLEPTYLDQVERAIDENVAAHSKCPECGTSPIYIHYMTDRIGTLYAFWYCRRGHDGEW